jgi:hypothetical protein
MRDEILKKVDDRMKRIGESIGEAGVATQVCEKLHAAHPGDITGRLAQEVIPDHVVIARNHVPDRREGITVQSLARGVAERGDAHRAHTADHRIPVDIVQAEVGHRDDILATEEGPTMIRNLAHASDPSRTRKSCLQAGKDQRLQKGGGLIQRHRLVHHPVAVTAVVRVRRRKNDPGNPHPSQKVNHCRQERSRVRRQGQNHVLLKKSIWQLRWKLKHQLKDTMEESETMIVQVL